MDKLKIILEMLSLVKEDQGLYIGFAKGKYKSPETIKEIYKVQKRNIEKWHKKKR